MSSYHVSYRLLPTNKTQHNFPNKSLNLFTKPVLILKPCISIFSPDLHYTLVSTVLLIKGCPQFPRRVCLTVGLEQKFLDLVSVPPL